MKKIEDMTKAELLLEIEKENKKSKIRQQKRMEKARVQGFKYFMVAWIHGRGDDYCVEVVFKDKPTQQDVDKVLKKSEEKNDFTITELKKEVC